MKKILVTGGMGYIGSHTIVELLKQKEWEVYSIDNFINSKPITGKRIQNLTEKRVKNFKVDLCQLPKLRSVFTQLGQIHGIIHFAALKSVEESMSHPLRYYRNNINSLLNLLECCHHFKVRHFIYSSSCSIYGDIPPEHQPVDEDTPTLPPSSPYAHSKKIGEDIIERFYSSNRMKVASLRYFNPAGADESGLIGEDPAHQVRNLVNVITRTAVENSKPRKKKKSIAVFGNDYATRDGTCIRDYIHVSDIARAHVDALKYLNRINRSKVGGEYQVFNLGTGNGVTVLEMIKAFEKVSGSQLPKLFHPRRPGDVMTIYSNNSKSQQILGWKPEFNIDDILRTAWKWELKKNR